MRLFLSGLTLLVAAAALAPTGNAFAPRPPSYSEAAATFRNADGDAIKSDVLGAYINGAQRGLEVRMWTCGDCSQDLTIGTFASGRTLYIDYTAKVSGDGPTGIMNDNAFVNIRDIAAMAPGETKITRASFNTSVGYFRWLDGPPPIHPQQAPPSDSYGSMAVEVTRSFDNPQTWVVTTPVPAVPYAGGDYAGDLSILLRDGRKNTLTAIGLYHLPFGLTVTCPNCS